MLLRQKKKGGQVFPCPIPSLLIFHLINPDSLPISHLCSTSLSPITTDIPLYAPPLSPYSTFSMSMLHTLYPLATHCIPISTNLSPFPINISHATTSISPYSTLSKSPYSTLSIPIPHHLYPHTPPSLSPYSTLSIHVANRKITQLVACLESSNM